MAYPDLALVAVRVGDVVENSVKIWSKTNHQYLHATIAHSRQLAKIWWSLSVFLYLLQ